MEIFENEHAIEDVQQQKYEPTLGILFDDHEVGKFALYKAYGKQEGFPVKKLTSKKGTYGRLRYVTFACGHGGKPKSQSSDLLMLKPIVKISCEARIGGCVNEDGKWVIRTLNVQHNHGLSPEKARFFPCNRKISASAKKRIEMNDCAGINIAQNFNSTVVETGGHENVSFLEKDCRNFVDKVRRLQLGEGNAMTILKYFKKKQSECKGFFFSINLDEHDQLKNVFWANLRSKATYKYFGDVITFGTTYLTNKYDMPFAPFVGVNHYGQSILLGWGLMSHEDTETFTWLFEAYNILLRWRKDVRRSYNKVKVSYGVHNLSIQQERYDKMCTAFAEVADVATDHENSYKFVLDWIQKAMKDLSKQIYYESADKTVIIEASVIGEGNYGSNNDEHVISE